MNELCKNIKETRLLSGFFLCPILLGLAPVTSGTMHLHTRFGPHNHTLNNHFKTNKTLSIRELFFYLPQNDDFSPLLREVFMHLYMETSLHLEISLLS